MATWLDDRTGPALVFPVRYDRLPFTAIVVNIVNNYSGTLYVSRVNPAPSASNKDVTVPPRTMLPIYGWNSYNLYIGSDGTPVRALDSLTVQVTDDLTAAAGFASSRLAPTDWYDRNPTTILMFGGGTITYNGAYIERWRYTVPANRKAYLDNASLIMRVTASNTPSAELRAFMTVNAPSATPFSDIITLMVPSGQTGNQDRNSYSAIGIVLPGYYVNQADSASVVGTYSIDLAGSMKATEYDA